MERRHAPAVRGIGDAHPGRDPVGARERSEIAVERAVLLHDDHDVPDLVDPGQRRDLDLQRGRGGPEVLNGRGHHRAPLLGAAGDERVRDRERRVALQPRPSHRLPARADAPLERHHLPGSTGLELAVQRLDVAGHGERRRARQRDRRAYALGHGPAPEPARGHQPVAVRGHRAGGHQEAVGPGRVGERPGHRAETVLSRVLAPQLDRDAAAADPFADRDEPAEDRDLARGGRRVRRRVDGQRLGERKPTDLGLLTGGGSRPR